jgi:chemotaxis protein methyltransferase CheR
MSLSRASFDYVRSVLRERSGRVLDDDKVYLVETRLFPLARRHGFPSVDDLLLRARSGGQEALLAEIVEAMAITETFFFRDRYPFDILRQTVLPALVSRRNAVRSLRIWSAACSSGQEAYSVAIMLRHHFPSLSNWNIRLIASDLSAEMLKRAEQGWYSDLEVSRGLPPELLSIYFDRREEGWQIRDDLRRMVEFHPINLGGDWPELPPLDLILLRNVLIYLDAISRQQILSRVRRVLQPDGYLLLGGSEAPDPMETGFVRVSFEHGGFFQPRRTE